MILASQSRAARGLLGWSQSELAAASKVSLSTIRDFETEKRSPMTNNLAAMRAAFEAAGVVILDDGAEAAGGPGVRLRKDPPSD